MTLILTIANARGVHQSSDYKLTDSSTGDPVLEQAGTKQLDAMVFAGMSIQLAFTGVARVTWRGQTVHTREWLQAELQALPPKSDLQSICEILAMRCRKQLKRLISSADLTLVLAVAEIGQPFRVAVISNTRTKGRFEIQVRHVKKPFHLISGYRDAVPETERHRLRMLARDTTKSPEEIRNALANINAVAADKSKGLISKECWVGSQFADGGQRRIEKREFGGAIEGSVPQLVGGVDMLQWIKENFQTAPGQTLKLHPIGAVMAGPGGGTPLPPPEGHPRTFTLSGGSISGVLKSPAGRHCASLKMTVIEHSVTKRRNEEAPIVPFAKVELTRVSQCEDFAKPLLPWPQAKPPLFVDGAEVPRGWEQGFGYWIEGAIQRISFPRTSRSIRNLAFLGDDDELLFAVNESELVLEPNESSIGIILTASVQWRSRLEGAKAKSPTAVQGIPTVSN